VAAFLSVGAVSCGSHALGSAEPAALRDHRNIGNDPARDAQTFDRLRLRAAAPAPVSKTPSAPASHAPFAQFEALVLQTFIQSMLPKDAESVYGKGLSGDMWQSMLAEKIAEQVTQRGGIGIAARLAQDYRASAGQ
jgi:peptidoglycan hydrolase FlgJ